MQNQINSKASAKPGITKISLIFPKGKWQEKTISVRQCKDLYRTIHNRRVVPQCTRSKFETWLEYSNSPRLTQAQWEHPFKNLYKDIKQKEAFDIRYRFLHLAQPSATKLREIGQKYGSVDCKRCGRAEEIQQH